MKNHDLLPPIIRDLIEDLRKDDTPIHSRDNVCARLENIVACSNEAIDTFRKKQTKYYTIKSKQKV